MRHRLRGCLVLGLLLGAGLWPPQVAEATETTDKAVAPAQTQGLTAAAAVSAAAGMGAEGRAAAAAAAAGAAQRVAFNEAAAAGAGVPPALPDELNETAPAEAPTEAPAAEPGLPSEAFKALEQPVVEEAPSKFKISNFLLGFLGGALLGSAAGVLVGGGRDGAAMGAAAALYGAIGGLAGGGLALLLGATTPEEARPPRVESGLPRGAVVLAWRFQLPGVDLGAPAPYPEFLHSF